MSFLIIILLLFCIAFLFHSLTTVAPEKKDYTPISKPPIPTDIEVEMNLSQLPEDLKDKVKVYFETHPSPITIPNYVMRKMQQNKSKANEIVLQYIVDEIKYQELKQRIDQGFIHQQVSSYRTQPRRGVQSYLPVSDDFGKVLDDTVFSGKHVAITGTFKRYVHRQTLKDLLSGYGAIIDNSVLKRTEIVVVGSDPGPSKMQKVKQMKLDGLKIKIMREAELYRILYGIKYGVEMKPLSAVEKKRLRTYRSLLVKDFDYGSNPFERRYVKIIGDLECFSNIDELASRMKKIYRSKIVNNIQNAHIAIIGKYVTSEQLDELFRISPDNIVLCDERRLRSFWDNIAKAERYARREYSGGIISVTENFYANRYIKPDPGSPEPPDSFWPELKYPE